MKSMLAALLVSAAGSLRRARRVVSRVAFSRRELTEARLTGAAATREALEARQSGIAFLAGMSHELRTPLNAIIGYAEVLTDAELAVDDKTRQEFLQDILAAGRHLQQLITDVVDLSKMDAGGLELQPEDVAVPAAIRGVQAVARSLTGRKRQRLEVEIDPAVGVLHHDPARLKQVLFGLIAHASTCSPEGGAIRIAARLDRQGWLEVAVSDSGGGLELQDLEQLFDDVPPAGTDQGRTRPASGLGLALVRRFVHLMGGDLHAGTVLGQGSTLTFRLPPAHVDGEGSRPHVGEPTPHGFPAEALTPRRSAP